jgi:hypothetical protein
MPLIERQDAKYSQPLGARDQTRVRQPKIEVAIRFAISWSRYTVVLTIDLHVNIFVRQLCFSSVSIRGPLRFYASSRYNQLKWISKKHYCGK